MKKLFPLLFLLIAIASSCTLEKRKYLKGYYFKKDKKVETSPTTQNNPPQNQSNPATVNPVNQTTDPPTQQQAQSAKPAPGHQAIPAFCIYGGLQEGITTISFNAEKIFCFGPYVDCFARGGAGLSDLNNSTIFKKYIFSGGGRRRITHSENRRGIWIQRFYEWKCRKWFLWRIHSHDSPKKKCLPEIRSVERGG